MAIRQLLCENTKIGQEKGRAVMKAKRILLLENNRKDAEDIISRLNKKFDKKFWKLLVAIFFWCEGSKRNLSSVGFINSDPLMITTFLKGFRRAFVLDESKFRVVVHLHKYHDQEIQKLFWSRITHIPISQFSKPYIKPNTGIRKRNGYPGCISIKYFDSRLALELDALYHMFANMGD